MPINLFGLIQAFQQNQNPMGLLEQMAQSNPLVNRAMKMTSGKSPQQMRQMAENMAREQGVDLEQLARQMGMRLPR